MTITDAERRDEQFMERIAICLEDGKLSEEAAIEVARIERRARVRKTVTPKQALMQFGK